jgi:DNA-directed RNA polymerase specialized sigma24 family protein
VKVINIKPWLTESGDEITTEELRSICINWHNDTWNRYLKWYCSSWRTQYARRVAELDLISEVTLPVEAAPLSPSEESVLKLVYLGGLSERETAKFTAGSKSTIHDIKIRALKKLKENGPANEPGKFTIMRGQDNEDTQVNSQCVQISPLQMISAAELESNATTLLGEVLTTISDRQAIALFVRFWRGFKPVEAAHFLSIGTNVIEQILDTAIFKIKRHMGGAK